MGTILDLNVLTAPATGDWLLIRDISDASDKDKKMALGYLAWKDQAVTPTVGRVARWKDANTLEDGGYLAADVARVNVAQTFSALQTVSAGVKFGAGSTLTTYVEAGTFTPQLADASSAGNQATASVSLGTYTRIGNRVWIDITLDNINTTGLTAANAIFIRNLPFVCISTANYRPIATVWTQRLNFTGNHLSAIVQNNASYILLWGHVNTGSVDATLLPVSIISSGAGDISISINYQCQ